MLTAASLLVAGCKDAGPKPPVAVILVAGNGQTAVAGAAVATPPKIKVIDVDSVGVAGGIFHFTVTSGGGTVAVATGTVGADGTASAGTWTLGKTAGTNVVLAAVEGLTLGVTFSATGNAGPASSSTPTAGDNQTAVAGAAVAIAPAVKVVDANGNNVSGASVTFTVTAGGGSVTNGATVTNSSGVATVGSWTLGSGAGTHTLSAQVAGITTPVVFTATATAPSAFNLTVDGMYLTQATQTYTGTVPIVAGRAALARVFVRATATNTAAPAVRLTTYQGGTLFKTYNIVAPASGVPQTIDEGALGSSWNVSIPASEVVANMTMLAEVDPTNTVSEATESDNKFPVSGTPQTLDVRTVPTMKITFIPVTQGGGTGDITTTNLSAYLDFPKRVYPWADVDAVIAPTPYSYATTLNGTSYDNSWTTLLSEISAKRSADGVTDRYYYAVVKPSYNNGGTGYGQIGGPSAIGVDIKFNGNVNPGSNYYSMTVGHELGHNFGRNHVGCGNPSNPDLNYPYSATTSIGAYGYDPVFGVLRGKDSFTDFMSYCSPLWISDYTYKAVMTWRSTRFAPPPSAKKSLLVWGRIGPSGIVLEPAFEVDAPVSLPERAGRYSVEAVDDAGRQVFTLSFDGYEADHAPGERNFAFTVPLPASGEVAELRLLDGTSVMARRAKTSVSLATAPQALASMRMRTLGVRQSRLEWDAQTFPMAMVRDAVTGEVLAFLRNGTGDLGTQRSEVDVLFSNGVTSIKRRVSINR